ncbi:MAG: HD domain-containing protein [Lachnospiraceae bacterium]|nr:HD domain-containing protein [Lachnospiraceae bacterium]
MKLCKVEDLAEGQLLSRAVFSYDFQILLAEGTELTEDYIEKLKTLGVTDVYIFDENHRNIEAVSVIKQDIEVLIHKNVRNILEKHTYSRNKELRELSKTAEDIVVTILNEKEVVDRIYDIKERSSDLYEHSISTCSLAALVALKLGLNEEKVHDISVACLLHDIGLRYIDFDYHGRSIDDFNTVEAVEYFKHPIYGYSSIKEETWISDPAKMIILYHHEHIDGSGFPMKIKEIPLEARIVAVCDTFDEMICGICQERWKVYEAIENLKVLRGFKYDEKVVNALLEFLAVYPVGSIVVTNDGETGMVVRQNRAFSERPVLKIIKDVDGNPLKEFKLIDMMKKKTVFIVKVVE